MIVLNLENLLGKLNWKFALIRQRLIHVLNIYTFELG